MATSSEETRYRQLLQELAGDLTSDEVRELIFLLRLHIKGKKIRSDIKSDATKLLTELEKLNCIGIDNLTLLVELFELIGRADLRNKIVEKHGHICQVSGPEQKINKFMRIMWKFGQKLDSNDLKNAKFILEWTRDKENVETVWQMFDKAFERGYIVENNINSVIEFAEKIMQIERLNSVMYENPFTYPSSNYSPGITSTPYMSQQQYLYTGTGITPKKEERYWPQEQPRPHWQQEQPRPHWPPEQSRPEKNLPHYSPYFGINQRPSPSNNQYFPQVSVLHEDDMSIPPSEAFRNVARDLSSSNTLTKTDPCDKVMEPVEKYQRQDASAKLKDGGHETNLSVINASLKVLELQNTIEEIIKGFKSQNEVKHARESSVTGSSSDNIDLTSGQTAPAGTQFKREISISHLNINEDPVSINVEPKSEQASERSEQKEASQGIRSSVWDEKHMELELNVSGSLIDVPNEVQENRSNQNEIIYLRDSGSLEVTSPLLINNQNEASAGIKMDITEDLKDREMPNANQSPSVENLTLSQTVQTEIGSFNGPNDAAPTPIFSQDSRSEGASQLAEQKEASQEICSIEEEMSKLNLSKESNASLNETRENNDLISEYLDIPYGQDELNEKRMPGNINQSNNDVTSKSKQDYDEKTSTSDENGHVGNGREGFSSSPARTSESGGDANGKQEAVDGKSTG
ncbi:hypothetical protein ACJMK2_039251 [Sinanodonta woodiana]|uniref:DED domain-containing protein n=1 Tax=Sinanodonta woodiana TaxID=1069815 RepID=A0ABD3WET4_SINWO